MNKSRQKFGQLLTEGLYALKLQEGKPLSMIQDELGYAIGRETGGSAFTHWRRGNIPASYTELESLARAMVMRGGLEKSWVEQLFIQTEYPSQALISALFPEGERTPLLHTPTLALPSKDYQQLVGREHFVQEIVAILGSTNRPNIVSIDGQGGIGKTALTLDVLDLCRRENMFDGYIWLSAARRPGTWTQTENRFTLETVLDTIGNQLNGDEFANATHPDKRRLVQSYLTNKRILIVLDNLETAVQAQDEIVEQLQPLLGQSKLILTSRHRFRQNGYAIHLIGLENERAAHLIQQVGQSKGITHIQDATTEEVNQIIRSTGGSPLAIQLVISQLHYLPLSIVLKSLREVTPLSQIAGEGEYVKFYKFIFHHSWSLLSDANKGLLITMAQFTSTNGAHFEAMQHISELGNDILIGSIEALWDISLLEVKSSFGVDKIRYYLHPLTQNFVLSDIRNEPSENRWETLFYANSQRFVRYWVTFSEENKQDYARLDLDKENILQSLQVAQECQMPKHLIRGAIALSNYLNVRSLYKLGDEYLQQAEQAARTAGEELLLAEALIQLATFAGIQGFLKRAESYLLQSLALLNTNETNSLLISAYRALGTLNYMRGSYADSEVYLLKGLDMARQLEDLTAICNICMNLGLLVHNMAAYDRAITFLEEGIAAARLSNDAKLLSDIFINKAAVLYEKGEHTRAETVYKEALVLAYEVGHKENIGIILNNLGELARMHHAYEQAKQYAEEALTLGNQIEHPTIISAALLNLGSIACETQQYTKASECLVEAKRVAETGADIWLLPNIDNQLGQVHFQCNRLDEAKRAFNQALADARQLNAINVVAIALFGLSQVAFAERDEQIAKQLGQESLALLEPTQHYKVAEIRQWVSQFEDG